MISREELEKRLRETEALLESCRSGIVIQGMRAEALRHESEHYRKLLMGWHGSQTAQTLRVIRAGWLAMRGKTPAGRPLKAVFDRAAEIAREEGLKTLSRQVVSRVRHRLDQRREARQTLAAESAQVTGETAGTTWTTPVPAARLADLRPQLLIIAELSLQQCAKYRVWQRQEELELLGWQVVVTDWRDAEASRSALQTCTEVIFYRTPAFPSVKGLIAEARRLGLSPWWEVDDLIFDASEYKENGNLDTLPFTERRQLLEGVRLFRECLLACDGGIASTAALAEAMRRAGMEKVCVIENALDRQTLELAARLRECAEPASDERLTIVYGSGTRTHDADFRECAAGLAAAMEAEPRLCLKIAGYLTLPEEFARFGDRVERLPLLDYPAYMTVLSGATLTIAPLEPTLFNDAKSNIKFLEAAILDVPAVCSPCDAFTAVIEPGRNGLLARTAEEWRDSILRLCHDPALRRAMGEQAREDVLHRYQPETVARAQVAPCFPPPVAALSADRPMRVLCANIYFAPRSFGGATLIAEEMARHLKQRGAEVAVFTAGPVHPDAEDASCWRYETEGMPVLATPLPIHLDPVGALDNPRCAGQFGAWLDAFRPDVVHLHSIQGLGLGLARACTERGIPYVITLHDAWWLCDRQFMVKGDGRYCFQRHIDLKVCATCVPMARHLGLRASMMHSALNAAALLLTPGESHRALYVENGVAPDRIRVNRNGFRWPAAPRTRRVPGTPLRFGYVGGAEAVKGYPLVRRAFEALSRPDWELVLIDNKLSLGFASILTDDWKTAGTVTVLPAYTQDTMDAFYDRIDVLLFPSQWMESYGLTVREALARDIWVISTAPGGQAEDIADGVNGTLIPLDGRADTLRSAVEGVLAQKSVFDAGYSNPRKAGLPTFESQAAELEGMLREVRSSSS